MKPIYPLSADLRVEPKPVPTAAIVTDAQAAANYDAEIEAWGERGWSTVARLCRTVESWESGNQLPFDCPDAPGISLMR